MPSHHPFLGLGFAINHPVIAPMHGDLQVIPTLLWIRLGVDFMAFFFCAEIIADRYSADLGGL